MLEVARRLQMGALFSMSVAKADLLRNQSVFRGTNMTEKKSVTVHYENGHLYVSAALSEEKDVTVVLVSLDGQEILGIQSAVWKEDDKTAVAEFEVEQLKEKYEIYVDVRDKLR